MGRQAEASNAHIFGPERVQTVYGLYDSNKLLYKRCAKSMGKPKIWPPTAPTFQPIFLKLKTKKYPWYDTACKIWLMWDDGKGVCRNGESWLTFGSFFFLYTLPRVQITH